MIVHRFQILVAAAQRWSIVLEKGVDLVVSCYYDGLVVVILLLSGIRLTVWSLHMLIQLQCLSISYTRGRLFWIIAFLVGNLFDLLWHIFLQTELLVWATIFQRCVVIWDAFFLHDKEHALVCGACILQIPIRWTLAWLVIYTFLLAKTGCKLLTWWSRILLVLKTG